MVLGAAATVIAVSGMRELSWLLGPGFLALMLVVAVSPGLVPPAMLALLTGGVRTMVLVVVAYTLINVVIQTVIQPKFVGDSVGLSATVTFVATVFWAWVLGPLGALLAIPMTLLAKAVLVDVDPASSWIDAVIGPSGAKAHARVDRGVPTPIPDEPADEGSVDEGSADEGPAADQQVGEKRP